MCVCVKYFKNKQTLLVIFLLFTRTHVCCVVSDSSDAAILLQKDTIGEEYISSSICLYCVKHYFEIIWHWFAATGIADDL